MTKYCVVFAVFVLGFFLSPPSFAGDKILVLYASIGNGHKSAGEAVAADLLALSPNTEVRVVDVFDFGSPKTKARILFWYNFLTQKTPTLYDLHFETYLNSQTFLTRSASDLLRQDHLAGMAKFREFIAAENPTVIFSTFNHTTEALIRLREEGQLPHTRIASVLTDYVAHPYYKKIAISSDMTFVPSAELLEYYNSIGTPENKMALSGIPVHSEITSPIERDRLASVYAEFNVKPDEPTVVLVSGAAGVGDFELMVKSIASPTRVQKLNLIVVCGRNAKQLAKVETLRDSLTANINLIPLALVPHDKMSVLLKMAKVIVTKSGGLTVTEVMHLQKPAIFLDINGGQEKYNSRYIESIGAGLVTSDQSKVGELLTRILNSESLQNKIVEAQAKAIANLDTGAVARWILNSIEPQRRFCSNLLIAN